MSTIGKQLDAALSPHQFAEVFAPPAPAKDITEDEQYARFVESMAPHCRCSRDCPCDGVLAGGLCDNIQDDLCDDDRV